MWVYECWFVWVGHPNPSVTDTRLNTGMRRNAPHHISKWKPLRMSTKQFDSMHDYFSAHIFIISFLSGEGLGIFSFATHWRW